MAGPGGGQSEKPPAAAPRQRTLAQVLQDNAPWKPVRFTPAIAMAMRALEKGSASPPQQKMALEWIINEAAGTYDEPYRPGGIEGERDTLLALGRAFVGRQIVKLLKIDLKTQIGGGT